MELIDVLHQIGEQGRRAAQPTDLVIGTVVAVNPLEISINTAMAPIRESILYLTANVIEKKITAIPGETITCYENGQALTNPTGYILLNKGLEIGDKVIMLKVNEGQRFIVLSRIF